MPSAPLTRRQSLALLAAPALPLPARAAPAAELVIGQVAPLTGVLASTGQHMVLGGRICFDAVNAAGGVHGALIRHEVLDDGYQVAETERATRSLLARPEVLALFGLAGTANISQLLHSGLLQQGGAALVAPYTGGEALRTPFNPWIFHLRAGYADEAEHMLQQLSTIGVERVAVMYQNDGFGLAGLAGVRAALARRSRQPLAEASYPRNTDQVEAAVQAIRALDAQAIIMIAVNRPAAAFIKRYRELGGGAQLYSISVVDPAELVQLAGLKNAHGVAITQVVPYPYRPMLPVVREYQQLLKAHAPGAEVNYTSFEEYLGAKTLVEALRRAGPQPTRARLLKSLEALHEFDLGGMTVSYGPDNRIGSRMVEVTVIGSNGRLVR